MSFLSWHRIVSHYIILDSNLFKRTKMASEIEKKEKNALETGKKVQEMQASLQAAAADAARAIAAQNS